MDLQEAMQVIEEKLGRPLKDVEAVIFRGSWAGLTYDEMVKGTSYEATYLKGDVGHKFWSELSSVLGEKVSKRNFKVAVEKLGKSTIKPIPSLIMWDFEDDYVPRTKIDAIATRNVVKPGSLLRIKGSPKMGKTMLLSRLIRVAEREGYKGIVISMREVSKDAMKSLDHFLQWFCLTVSGELRLQREFAEFNWNKQLGESKQKATWYFEDHLLSESQLIVLGLDELGKIFDNHEISEGFFSLLRTWHENANRDPQWRGLNLILSYTTEYDLLNIHLSPFNVGTPLMLKEFTEEEIKELAEIYKVELSDEEVKPLLEFLGGHPYLVSLTLEYMIDGVNTLEEIIKQAKIDGGIYQDFLQQLLQMIINGEDNLKEILKRLLEAKMTNDPNDAKKILELEDLGLIRRVNHHAEIRYLLYQTYFKKYL